VVVPLVVVSLASLFWSVQARVWLPVVPPVIEVVFPEASPCHPV
jgi:hypothetical protein